MLTVFGRLFTSVLSHCFRWILLSSEGKACWENQRCPKEITWGTCWVWSILYPVPHPLHRIPEWFLLFSALASMKFPSDDVSNHSRQSKLLQSPSVSIWHFFSFDPFVKRASEIQPNLQAVLTTWRRRRKSSTKIVDRQTPPSHFPLILPGNLQAASSLHFLSLQGRRCCEQWLQTGYYLNSQWITADSVAISKPQNRSLNKMQVLCLFNLFFNSGSSRIPALYNNCQKQFLLCKWGEAKCQNIWIHFIEDIFF